MRVMNQRYHPPVAEWINLGVLSYFNYFKPTTLLSDSIMIESCLLVKGAWFVNFLQLLGNPSSIEYVEHYKSHSEKTNNPLIPSR